MLKLVECLGKKIYSIACSRDVQSTYNFGSDEIMDEVPMDVNVFGLIVEDRVVKQGDHAGIVSVDIYRLIKIHEKLLT